MSELKIGILVTHPVQYQVPLFREIAAHDGVDLRVYYAHRPTPVQQGEDFGVAFEWDVDLLSGYASEFLENRAAARGTGFGGYNTPQIATIIAREQFDAFIVSGWHSLSYWQAIRACWATRTPVMVRGDSQLYDDRSLSKRLIKRLLYRAFVPRFDACLSVGTRSSEYFHFYGARRVIRVPHFVDNERFSAEDRAPATRRALRARWSIAADDFVVVLPAKLIERKRPVDLIRAAASLGRGVHILFAGDGTLRRECEDEARRHGVAVTFAGFLNQREIPTAYAVADVMALPSSQDTWGLVANEAMASGLPIVVSEACGCAPDLVVSGVTGFAFPVGDVDALAAALGAVRDAAAAGRGLGPAAQRHIQDYSAERAAQALLGAATAVWRRAPPLVVTEPPNRDRDTCKN